MDNLENYEEKNELRLMEGYKQLKEMMASLGLPDEVPSFEEFKNIYNEELAASQTKH